MLAIDGGGVRGIIPARILAEIELRTKRNISDIFKMNGGTSTGSIVATSLNIPEDNMFSVGNKKPKYTGSDIVKFYTHKGEEIFPKGGWSIFNKASNMFYGSKYRSKGLVNVLKEYMGETKMENLINEVIVLSTECNQ